MNFYVGVINEVIDYIEVNVNDKLTLSALSEQFGLSDFHFNRMFKTVAGITLKQYIQGRKLTKAMELLKKTNRPVIDIALDLGFEYPEVFSRAFKRQFNISPAQFRDSSVIFDGTEKANIVERDIINYRGVLALKGYSTYLDEFSLTGASVDINVNNENFKDRLNSNTESFILQTSGMSSIFEEKLYTIVNCHGENNGEYTVFCGRKLMERGAVDGFIERVVPAGWYISFKYHGDMFDIRESFTDDLYRWIIVNEAEIAPNGIGMINIFNNDYPKNDSVDILIPVKKPV